MYFRSKLKISMITNLLQLLEYNFWANDQFIIRLEEQPVIPEKISSLMSHILNAHHIWLARIQSSPQQYGTWDLIDSNQWSMFNLQQYHQSTDLVRGGNLKHIISYQNSKGERYSNEVWEVIMHIINHSTHHRAQIASAMRNVHLLPPATDLIFYLRN